MLFEGTRAENGGGTGKRSVDFKLGLAARRSAFVAFTISLFVAWLGSGDKILMTIVINEVMTVRNRAIYNV